MQTIVDRVLGTNTPYITYAVPVFFLLIGVEVVFGWITHRKLYRVNDTINNLSCGILQQVLGIFMKTILFVAYLSIYQEFRVLEIEALSPAAKWVAAIGLFLGVDFCYYWFHRISHEMNAPWAGHVVHHQSEEYNLAVALRQGTFQACFSWVFYLPLALIGFPPVWFVTMSAFNTLYQFWIHTKVIGKLGWFEYVFNTPSHHRVHHGRNPKYLDRNHAGTLIIWDRMFGTFQEEDEEVVYGITRPLNSWNPLWANFDEFVYLWRDAVAAPYWVDKIKIWFMHPGWRPRGLTPNPPPPEVTPASITKYDATIPKGLAAYSIIHFVMTLVVSIGIIAAKDIREWDLLLPAGYVLMTLASLGALFDHKAWAFFAEFARQALFFALVMTWTSASPWFAYALAGWVFQAVISLPWLWHYRSVIREPVTVRAMKSQAQPAETAALG